MLLTAYSRGKSAALAKFAALLSPQEEQAFGYGNAAQRANQVHGVAGAYTRGSGMGQGNIDAAHIQRGVPPVNPGAETRNHRVPPPSNPLLEGGVSQAPGHNSTGVLPAPGAKRPLPTITAAPAVPVRGAPAPAPVPAANIRPPPNPVTGFVAHPPTRFGMRR